MQIYLKPYQHNTYCNVPYKEEKTRSDGSRNYGYKDVKKFKGLIKKIPEIENFPKLGELIQCMNNGVYTTYGCDTLIEPVGSKYHQAWITVNFHFDDMNNNQNEEHYFNLVRDFLTTYAAEKSEYLVIEFVINPTNFHDPVKIKKGASPSEKTVLFRGYSVNYKISGVGETQSDAKKLLDDGLNYSIDFFTNCDIINT